jgi:hypothetical protein
VKSVVKQQNKQQTNQEREVMNDKFDEPTKSLAQSVTRRGALKRFGVGLAGMALACLDLSWACSGLEAQTTNCFAPAPGLVVPWSGGGNARDTSWGQNDFLNG